MLCRVRVKYWVLVLLSVFVVLLFLIVLSRLGWEELIVRY